MVNTFKAGALRDLKKRLELYGLDYEALPDKVDGSSSGYQCICKITSRDHFTLYHSGKLDKSNECGIEVAFSLPNIAQSLDRSELIISSWLQRISGVLPIASPKTSHKYPRVGLLDDRDVSYFISQLDFMYGINKPAVKSFSLRPNRAEQAAFRARLLSAYKETCMVTGCSDIEVLEACHIVPDSKGGEYFTRNGLLLRADLHKLFDEGLMSIHPVSGEVFFSKALTSEVYVKMANEKIRVRLPDSQDDYPEAKRMAEHFNLYFTP